MSRTEIIDITDQIPEILSSSGTSGFLNWGLTNVQKLTGVCVGSTFAGRQPQATSGYYTYGPLVVNHNRKYYYTGSSNAYAKWMYFFSEYNSITDFTFCQSKMGVNKTLDQPFASYPIIGYYLNSSGDVVADTLADGTYANTDEGTADKPYAGSGGTLTDAEIEVADECAAIVFGCSNSSFNLKAEITYYSINFDVDGTVQETIEAEKGELLTPTISPEKEFYVFAGWALADGTKIDLTAYTAAEDTTVYAVWEVDPNYVTVYFNSNGGTAIADQLVKIGGYVTKPTCIKLGYVLSYWSADGSTIWNFETTQVTASTTLNAIWMMNPEYYEVINWKNEVTPINETNLNHMDSGIYNATVMAKGGYSVYQELDGSTLASFVKQQAGEAGVSEATVQNLIDTAVANYTPKTDYEEKVSEIDNKLSELASAKEEITVLDSDKIVFFGNSFGEYVAIEGQSKNVNFNTMLDYQVWNYSTSGGTMYSLLDEVKSGKAKFGDYVKAKDCKGTYAVIPHMTNDTSTTINIANDSYYYAAKALSSYLKGLGMTPIFSTEHNTSPQYYETMELAREQGYMFMDYGYLASQVLDTGFTVLYWAGHPATRTAWTWYAGMMPYFLSLPKVRKGIKVYLPRNEDAEISDLLYDTNKSRFQLWQSISGGYSANRYADTYDQYGLSDNSKSMKTVANQYAQLASGGTVTLRKKALVEIITPYDANHIGSCEISLTTNATKAYLRKVVDYSFDVDGTRYTALGLGDTDESAFDGATLLTATIDGTTVSWTILGVANGNVYTSTTNNGNSPTVYTGTVEATLNNGNTVTLKNVFRVNEYKWASRYTEPLCEWEEVAIADGKIALTADQLYTCVDFDKISLLLVNDSASITLSSISAEVSGVGEKDRTSHYMIPKPIKGTTLLSETDFSANQSKYSFTGTYSFPEKFTATGPNSITLTETFPSGTTSILQLDKGATLLYNISNFDRTAFSAPMVQIRVLSRYLPTMAFTEDQYAQAVANGDAITQYSCPTQELRVGLSSSTDVSDIKSIKYIAKLDSGLWWQYDIINVPLQHTGNYLVLESTSKNIQIARLEVVQIDNYESININH